MLLLKEKLCLSAFGHLFPDGTAISASLESHGHLWWYPWQRDDWRVPGAGDGKAAEGVRG